MLREMVNIKNVKCQPEPYGYFMFGLTFWQVGFLEVGHFSKYQSNKMCSTWAGLASTIFIYACVLILKLANCNMY
jgi:hypothetical protein